MSVQFICEHCHKLLKVGSRKIGCEVTCPKCGRPMVVPDEETAAVEVAMHVATKGAKPEGPALPEFAVFDDLLPPVVTDAPSAPDTPARVATTAPPAPARVSQPVAQPPHASAIYRPAYPAAPRGPMLLVSRKTLYVQAALFIVLALAAFGAGFLIGRGAAPAGAAAGGNPEPVVVEGTLTFTSTAGDLEHDTGAVVMLIPEGKFPEPKWSTKGLSPREPEPVAGSQVLLEVEEIGARYARTDEKGYFQLAVPVSGTYHLLMVSHNASRPTGQDIPERDLNELRRYFTPAPEMIGRSKYRWAKVELAAGPIRQQPHDFGIDRQ